MDYQKLYNRIIKNRKLNPFDGYTERHHITPKCLGGNNKKENLVDLSAREHFLCHYCLTQIYKDDKTIYPKMLRAFIIMKAGSVAQINYGAHSKRGRRYMNSRLYTILKEDYSKLQSKKQKGTGNSHYDKRWVYNLELKQSKSIIKTELDLYLERGWIKGKIQDFDKFFEKLEIKKLKERRKEIKKISSTQKKIVDYTKLYEIYKLHDFDTFCNITDYAGTRQTLSYAFRTYVPTYYGNFNIDKSTMPLESKEKISNYYKYKHSSL